MTLSLKRVVLADGKWMGHGYQTSQPVLKPPAMNEILTSQTGWPAMHQFWTQGIKRIPIDAVNCTCATAGSQTIWQNEQSGYGSKLWIRKTESCLLDMTISWLLRGLIFDPYPHPHAFVRRTVLKDQQTKHAWNMIPFRAMKRCEHQCNLGPGSNWYHDILHFFPGCHK